MNSARTTLNPDHAPWIAEPSGDGFWRVVNAKSVVIAERLVAEEARLVAALPEVLDAARLVVARWSDGDLAEAVRQLARALAPRDPATPGPPRADALHPQRRRIEQALDLLSSVSRHWDEDEVLGYPHGLPSFDEYVAEVGAKLRSIRWRRQGGDWRIQ